MRDVQISSCYFGSSRISQQRNKYTSNGAPEMKEAYEEKKNEFTCKNKNQRWNEIKGRDMLDFILHVSNNQAHIWVKHQLASEPENEQNVIFHLFCLSAKYR